MKYFCCLTCFLTAIQPTDCRSGPGVVEEMPLRARLPSVQCQNYRLRDPWAEYLFGRESKVHNRHGRSGVVRRKERLQVREHELWGGKSLWTLHRCK